MSKNVEIGIAPLQTPHKTIDSNSDLSCCEAVLLITTQLHIYEPINVLFYIAIWKAMFSYAQSCVTVW